MDEYVEEVRQELESFDKREVLDMVTIMLHCDEDKIQAITVRLEQLVYLRYKLKRAQHIASLFATINDIPNFRRKNIKGDSYIDHFHIVSDTQIISKTVIITDTIERRTHSYDMYQEEDMEIKRILNNFNARLFPLLHKGIFRGELRINSNITKYNVALWMGAPGAKTLAIFDVLDKDKMGDDKIQEVADTINAASRDEISGMEFIMKMSD